MVLENFEKVFLNYINENYNKFSEADLQKLFHDILKVNILHEFRNAIGNPNFTDIDPYKVKFILKKMDVLKETNEEMRDHIHTIGVMVNQLAQSSVKLKQDYHSTSADAHLREIGSAIDKLNHLFNDIYLKVMENDTRINDVKVICKQAVSYQSHLTKYDKLNAEYVKLETLNLELKNKLYEQVTENKLLQDDFEVAKKLAD